MPLWLHCALALCLHACAAVEWRDAALGATAVRSFDELRSSAASRSVLRSPSLQLTRLRWAGVEGGLLFQQLHYYAPAKCFATNGSGEFCPQLPQQPEGDALLCEPQAEEACAAAERQLQLSRQTKLATLAFDSLYLASPGEGEGAPPPPVSALFGAQYGLEGALLLRGLGELSACTARDAAVLLDGATPGLPLWLRRLRDVALPAGGVGLTVQRVLYDASGPDENCVAPACLHRAALLLNPWEGNIQHWVTEQLPRVALLRQLQPRPTLLLQPGSGTQPYQLELLQAAGFARHQLVEWRAPLRVRELYLPGFPCVNFQQCNTETSTPLFADVRALLGVGRRAEACTDAQRRLFISRNDSAHTAGAKRLVVNEASLEEVVVRAQRFAPVTTLGLGAAERVALFRCAREVVVLFGAGVMNTLFMASDTRVLALSGRHFRSHGGHGGRRSWFAKWVRQWGMAYNEAIVEDEAPDGGGGGCLGDNCPWAANSSAVADALRLWRARVGVDWDR